MNNKRAIIVSGTILLLLHVRFSMAGISLPTMFQDNMVFQRDELRTVWGKSDPSATITISFGCMEARTIADTSGNWEVQFPAAPAGGPFELRIISLVDTVSIKNVFLGDVWLFCGQSNMYIDFNYYLDLKNIGGKYINRFKKDQQNCHKEKLIRIYMVTCTDGEKNYYISYKKDHDRSASENRWSAYNRQVFGDANPIAYYFSRELSGKTGVMTAVVRVAWGSHKIEYFYKGAKIYNYMLRPWGKFRIKGVVWYQGESNLMLDGDGLGYALKLQHLIKDCRELWNDAKLHFLIVQLPPAVYSKYTLNDKQSLPVFLEAQRQALAIPFTSMAVTSDLGMTNDLHQCQKYELAIRLADLALANVYNHHTVTPAGPQFKRIHFRGNKIIVEFETFGSRLKTKDRDMPRFFEIAEYTGGNFLPARAMLEGNTVVLWNEKIEKPRDVRFAFSEENLMSTNLVNLQGVPAATFWVGAMSQLHPAILNEMKNAASKP